MPSGRWQYHEIVLVFAFADGCPDEVFRSGFKTTSEVKIIIKEEFTMAVVIYFHDFCLTLIQCSFNVALLNNGLDCNLKIKNAISVSYIAV